jgi:hypothetical protein
MIGFIAIGSLKTIFPLWVDSETKVALWFIFTVVSLWSIGYLDKKLKLLHAESSYSTEVNPLMMEVIDNTRKNA